MALRIDKEGLANEILNKLKIELDVVFEVWEKEVYDKLKYPIFRSNAVIESYLTKETNKIVAYLKANIYTLADSYGTGSLMLSDNPGFQSYRNSNRWNPARRGKTIVGRPRGTYKDTFGNTKKSLGTMEGVPIEGLEKWHRRIVEDDDSSEPTIEPVSPSYALQDAEKFLYSTYLPNAYKLAIKNINFSKYLIES